MMQLGLHLRSGKGVQWSETEAMQWFTQAAELGAVDAMTALGVGFMAGLGRDEGQGRQDYAQAAYWFRRAAEHGDGFAQINLGILYEQGWGVDADPDRARQLYAQAASNTSPEVANLGRQYFSAVQNSPAARPDDLSDFWKTVIVVGIAAGGLAVLSRIGSSSDTGSSSDRTVTVSTPNIDLHDGFGLAGLPCTVGQAGCTPY
jgi:TPR repeat protein